jgi:nitrogenase molybdenum-iron protein alpha/beta subunit
MIDPDAFTGAILAAEGVRDGAVLLNGPTGCKFHHGALSESLYPRKGSLDPLDHADQFYFGQPRVPCTYLQEEEYIQGTGARLQAITPVVMSRGPALVTVINSPGASLIGDEVSGIVGRYAKGSPVAVLETCAFSAGLGQGFQDCALRMLDALPLPEPQEIPGINLVGISILDHGWASGVRELRRLLSLCGVRVGAVLCAGCSTAEMSLSRHAPLSVVMDQQMGGRVAMRLMADHDVRSVSLGQPIGFQGTARWLEGVCSALDVDPAPALEELRAEERRCAFLLARHSSLTGLPKGATFSLQARPAVALGLLRFLYEYLGMVPVCVECTGEGEEEVQDYLEMNGLRDALRTRLLEQPCHLMLGDGNTLAMAQVTMGVPGIEIAPPYSRAVRIRDTSLWGVEGAVDLLDRIIEVLGERW